MPKLQFLSVLEKDVEGLRFRSETDRPFDVFHWGQEDLPEISQAALLAFLAKPADTPFEEITLDYLFRNVSKVEDWQDEDVQKEVPRYQKITATLEKNLKGLKVLRVGAVTIDVYIVGHTPEGDWAGLHTVVRET